MNNIPNKINPLPNMLLTIGLLPSSYLVSMTYEEQLLWLCNFLKTEVIPKTNANIEAVNQLITYIDNYFDNLDVQDEIDHKLEEMAESGELQEIITEYLQINGVLGFNTVSDMVNATNIINGSICRTLGLNIYNDGKGAFYKVRTITSGDVVDGVNIIALNVSDTLIAELMPDYNLTQEITNRTNADNKLSKDIDNNRLYNINLMTNITYDFGSDYSQGICVDGDYLYVYRELNDSNGKLMKFNYKTYEFISETTVDFGHGNDLTIINGVIYGADTVDGKQITAYNLSTSATSKITLNTEENKIIGVAKEDNDNLLVMATSGNMVDFSSISFYRYNLTNQTTTKLNYTSTFTNIFYASQGMEYYDGYIYCVVSNPDSIYRFKVNNDNTITFDRIFELPIIDNLGLLIGEYEGIALINSNGDMILSSHILELTNRTLKTYIVNFKTNTPKYPKKYSDIPIIENESYQKVVYVNNNNTSLLELGTSAYPFKSLNRAIECVKNNGYGIAGYNIRLYNGLGTSYTYEVDVINNVRAAITAWNNNITLKFKRILDSDLIIQGLKDVNANYRLNLENVAYAGKVNYGTISNSKIKFINVNFDIKDGITMINSDINFNDIHGTANNSDSYVFKIYNNTTVRDGINWETYFQTTKKYYELSGVACLEKISDVTINSTTQSNWFSDHVLNVGGSSAYCVLFSGKHTTD